MRRVSLAAAIGLLAAAALAGEGTSPPVLTTLTIFAGTDDGLYRTTDWGGSWKPIPGAIAGDPIAKVGAVRDVLALPEVVLMASDGGAFVSRDWGDQWKKAGAPGPLTCFLPSWAPQADTTMFACGPRGLLKSRDGGYTFAPTAISGLAVSRLLWPGPDLVVATAGGVLLSDNAAASFRPLGQGLPPGAVTAIVTSSHYMIDPVLFAAVGRAGLFRTQDAGRTWVLKGLEGREISDLEWVGIQLFAATDQGVFLSEDAGDHWEGPFAHGLPAVPTGPLLFPQAPASTLEAFLGTDRGVFHSMDAARTWTPSGLADRRVLALATFPPPPSVPSTGRRR